MAGETGICSRDFASANEALAALGGNVVRVADVKEITPQMLNALARKAGARVYAEPGNVTYVGRTVESSLNETSPATATATDNIANAATKKQSYFFME